MINPGDTIPMEDYGEVAGRFSFYMTHGLEQNVPLAFGNMTWFTGANKDFVVLENSPHPDYQWFYDPTWSYTTAQITANEEAIFDHMFHNVGRGVIFNEMWHDYSISSAPVNEGKDKRITNQNNFPFYEAMKTKFGTLPIYCPEPQELAQKLRAMAQWNYSWKASDDSIEMTLDLASLRRNDTAESLGGMGIRVENTRKFIQSVLIDGHVHPAFDDRLLILPNLAPGKKHSITIKLGAQPTNSTSSDIRVEGNDRGVADARWAGLQCESKIKGQIRRRSRRAGGRTECRLAGVGRQQWSHQRVRALEPSD